MPEDKQIRVTWNDAQDHPDKWVDAEDAKSFTDIACTVVSIGFLVKKTDKYITIAGDWDPSDLDYGRVTKIPISMVLKIEGLDVCSYQE